MIKTFGVGPQQELKEYKMKEKNNRIWWCIITWNKWSVVYVHIGPLSKLSHMTLVYTKYMNYFTFLYFIFSFL